MENNRLERAANGVNDVISDLISEIEEKEETISQLKKQIEELEEKITDLENK